VAFSARNQPVIGEPLATVRDIALTLAIVAGLGITLFYPFAGVILWTWFTLQNPHEEAYGFSRSLPLNLFIAIVTIGAWLLSGERKLPPSRFLIWIMLLFLAWTTFNSFFAFSPDWSWPFWDRTWKIFALALIVAAIATNRVRIHAIIWTIVLSLFYYGVKGGIFTLVTGGNFHVQGPEHTIIGDNNQLALALLMSLPLANYLRTQTANKYISWGLLAGMGFTLISVVGSYSRGAVIALGALAIFGWLRSRRKILYLVLAGVFVFGTLNFMPAAFWDRVNSIQTTTAQDDPSVHGRIVAWQVAYRYANDHFPFGAGFYGPQLPSLFHSYFPMEEPHAAHSIYFQVLGEHGYIGLVIYLMMIAGAFWSSRQIIKRARDREELSWAGNLALMIQMSFIAFCVGGAALSMAYYDVFILCIGLLVPLQELVREPQQSIFPLAWRRESILRAKAVPAFDYKERS
jgi:putative inorganic carbon (hco3(-)) transporter